MSCLQTEENAIGASKIGPPVKSKWRRWITDNIFVQIVSKSRRRGGWLLLGKITAILGQLIMVLNYSIDFPDPGRLSQTLPYLVYCVPYSCHFSSNWLGFIVAVQNLPPQIFFVLQKCTATHRVLFHRAISGIFGAFSLRWCSCRHPEVKRITSFLFWSVKILSPILWLVFVKASWRWWPHPLSLSQYCFTKL